MNQRQSLTKVITLALLHPLEGVIIQSWSFENKPLIKVGRSKDNDVVLISSVVSRHHFEITWQGNSWELENSGVNGTYVENKRIEKIRLEDGMIVRLAPITGPRLQISIPSEKSAKKAQSKTSLDQEIDLSSETEKDTMVPENGK